MTELDILFSPEELQAIEEATFSQMDGWVEDKLSQKIQNQLTLMVGHPEVSLPDEWSKSQQLTICGLFVQANQEHQQQIDQLHQQISSLIKNTDELNKTNEQNMNKIEFQQQKIKQLFLNIQGVHKQYTQSRHEIYRLNQTILMQKAQLDSFKMEQIRLIAERDQELNQQREAITDLEVSLSTAIQQRDQFNNLSTLLTQQFAHLQNELIREVENSQSQLITLTIQANSLYQQHQELITYIHQSNRINNQLRTLVHLMESLQANLKPYDLPSLEQAMCQFQAQSLPIDSHFSYQQNILEGMSSLIELYGVRVNKMRQLLQESRRHALLAGEQCGKLLADKERCQRDLNEQKLKSSQLQQTVTNLTQANYRVLLDMTQNKLLLENNLERSAQNIKQLQQSLNDIFQQSHKYQQIIKDMKDKQKQMEQMFSQERSQQQQQLQYANHNYQHLKDTINHLTQSSALPQASADLIQSLLEKQASLAIKLAEQRSTLRTSQQSNWKLQESLAQKEKELMESEQSLQKESQYSQELIQKNQYLELLCKEQGNLIEQFEVQIKEKDKQIEELNLQITRVLKESEAVQKDEKQVQTIEVRRQAGIKRQNISSQQSSNSHSLSKPPPQKQNIQTYDDKVDIKSKKLNQNCSGDSCRHLQKVNILNQVINYMMNHMKGYEGFGIRIYSWFSYQISRYGQSYEIKLTNPEHLRIKMENKRLIKQLCLKEPGLEKMVKQFEGIMEYYFKRGQRSETTLLLDSTMPKHAMGRTITKGHREGSRDRNMTYYR